MLINLAKSEMGGVRKQMLHGINSKLKRGLDVTLWKNLAEVIGWFQSIEMKESCSFVSLDIVKFYPSISEDVCEELYGSLRTM